MSDKKLKAKKPAFVIMKRELRSYFSGPIGYIVTGLFLVISGLLFFAAFFLQNRADLRNFFSNISIWLLIALIISIYSKSSLKASLNTFVFFVGVTVSYHLYTVLFSGFNPKYYMMIWYGLTIVSPLLAFICFYSKSDNKISIIISSLILYVMFSMCFNIGMWYFDIKTILDLIVFLISCYVLYVKPKNIVISLFIGLVLSFLIRIPYYI